MAAPEVREVEHRFNLWGGFRDEMIATAMTLSLLVVGSFVLTQRLLSPSGKFQPETTAAQPDTSQTLGIQDIAPTPVAPPVQQFITAPTASDSADLTEVTYGQDGDYDFSGYTISFRYPRLVFDKNTNNKRKLWVNV